MTAREFVDEIAVPTVREFMDDPARRRGYLACLVAFHVGDYLAPGHEPTRKLWGVMEARLGASFIALRHMANAAKHSEASSRGVVLVQSGSDSDRPQTGFGIGGNQTLRFDDRGGTISSMTADASTCSTFA